MKGEPGMPKKNVDALLIVVFVTGSLLPTGSTMAQPAPVPFHTIEYTLTSGVYNGQIEWDREELVWQDTIQVAGSPWLRLYFGITNLGNESYLKITSVLDGSSQRLNSVSLFQWHGTSAYFNGDAILIQLFADPQDVGLFVEVKKVSVGEYESGRAGIGSIGGPGGEVSFPSNIEYYKNDDPIIETICGPTDDRIPSSEPAVGRMLSESLSGGCTGWILPNALQVMAGHCVTYGSDDVLQFNVPSSLSDGTIQHPPPEDQYSVNQIIDYQYTGVVGLDWAVFTVFDNSETGLQPLEAQNESFLIAQDTVASPLRLTGYGMDSDTPENNQVQQTDTGPNDGSTGSNYIILHRADTEGGSSGSPIIDENTGRAIGVHTNGGCTSSGGNNKGTSFYNDRFWTAVGADGAPSTPTGFNVTKAGGANGHPKLSWNANTEPDMKGYEIWRKLPGVIWTNIAFVNHPINYYHDYEVAWGDKFDPNVCYRISAVDIENNESILSSQDCAPFRGIQKTSVSQAEPPSEYGLEDNFPNPFNPMTTIKYQIPVHSHVNISIFNIWGQQIRTLVSEPQVPAFHSVIWDGRDSRGAEVSSGVYLYCIKAASLEDPSIYSMTKKMILLR